MYLTPTTSPSYLLADQSDNEPEHGSYEAGQLELTSVDTRARLLVRQWHSTPHMISSGISHCRDKTTQLTLAPSTLRHDTHKNGRYRNSVEDIDQGLLAVNISGLRELLALAGAPNDPLGQLKECTLVIGADIPMSHDTAAFIDKLVGDRRHMGSVGGAGIQEGCPYALSGMLITYASDKKVPARIIHTGDNDDDSDAITLGLGSRTPLTQPIFISATNPNVILNTLTDDASFTDPNLDPITVGAGCRITIEARPEGLEFTSEGFGHDRLTAGCDDRLGLQDVQHAIQPESGWLDLVLRLSRLHSRISTRLEADESASATSTEENVGGVSKVPALPPFMISVLPSANSEELVERLCHHILTIPGVSAQHVKVVPADIGEATARAQELWDVRHKGMSIERARSRD